MTKDKSNHPRNKIWDSAFTSGNVKPLRAKSNDLTESERKSDQTVPCSIEFDLTNTSCGHGHKIAIQAPDTTDIRIKIELKIEDEASTSLGRPTDGKPKSRANPE